jgi:hypothetical protein
MNQVHKENLTQVENALPNRQGLEVEIFGMEGIPQDMLDQHRNRILQNFQQAQKDRQIATGNPLPGQGHQQKKIKTESPDDLKKRLAEFRQKKKEIAANGGVDPAAATAPAAAETQASFVSVFSASFLMVDLLTCVERTSCLPITKPLRTTRLRPSSPSRSATLPLRGQQPPRTPIIRRRAPHCDRSSPTPDTRWRMERRAPSGRRRHR